MARKTPAVRQSLSPIVNTVSTDSMGPWAECMRQSDYMCSDGIGSEGLWATLRRPSDQTNMH